MNEIIERLARVIDPFVFGVAHDAPDAADCRDEARKVARNVLRELREPTEAMVKAGEDVRAYDGIEEIDSYGHPKSVWAAMIAAALIPQ